MMRMAVPDHDASITPVNVRYKAAERLRRCLPIEARTRG